MNILPLLWVIIGFLAGIAARTLFVKYANNKIRKESHNIGLGDRVFRFGAAIILLIVAYRYQWSAPMLFLSGFCFAESLFSWCGLYAMIGKSTCVK